MRRLSRWLILAALAAIAVFAIGVLLSLRHGDPALWPPAPGSPTITVFVVSHGYHAGIALPRAIAGEVAGRHGLPALTAVTRRFVAYPWLELGWGDEGFYREVPTVASLNVGLALRALLRPGNPSVVHVVGVQGEPPAVFLGSDIVRLDLTEAGFARLAAKVDATFTRPPEGEKPDELGPGLYGPSLFYRAVGAFHLFNVCNHWIADLLAAAGVPTARALATLPAGLLLDLRWRAGRSVLARPQRHSSDEVERYPEKRNGGVGARVLRILRRPFDGPQADGQPDPVCRQAACEPGGTDLDSVATLARARPRGCDRRATDRIS